MGHEVKCDICGKKYWQDSSALAKFTGAANYVDRLHFSML